MNKMQTWLLIGAIILLAISIYFLALSNRYMAQTVTGSGHQLIFDKWTRETVKR